MVAPASFGTFQGLLLAQASPTPSAPASGLELYCDGSNNLHVLNAASDTTLLINPMTTAGDLIVGGSSGTPTRLGIGSANQVLTVSGGTAAWVTPPVGGILAGSGVLSIGGTALVSNSFILGSSVITACYANNAAGFNPLGITTVSTGNFTIEGAPSQPFFWMAAITPSPNIVYGVDTFDNTGQVTVTNSSIRSTSTIVATYSTYLAGRDTIGINNVTTGSFIISGSGGIPFFWIAVI